MDKLGHMVFDLILNNDFVPKKTMILNNFFVMKENQEIHSVLSHIRLFQNSLKILNEYKRSKFIVQYV